MFVSMKQVDVLCIGYACWDLNFNVPALPGPDEKIMTDRMISEGGGPAANAAYAVNRLGGRAALAGRLGKDAWGRAHLEELQSAGVDTSCILLTDTPTSQSVILVTPGGHRSLVNYRPGAAPQRYQFNAFNPGCILVDGHEPEGAALALEQFQGVPSLLDAGSLRTSTKDLLDKVRFVVASAAFARELSASGKPDDWIACLSQYPARVAVTDGNRGVYWKEGQNPLVHLPALDVSAIDTNAAGDIFHGACALALARGHTFDEALRWANRVAGISTTRAGGRTSCPAAEEVGPVKTDRKR